MTGRAEASAGPGSAPEDRADGAGAVDTSSLLDSIGRLSLAATAEFDLDSMLRELCDVAVGPLRVDGVGVMARGHDTNRFVHATGPLAVAAAERSQELLGEGPCHDAVRTGAPVTSADLATDTRWPGYSGVAVRTPLRAVAAVPLRSRGRSWGVLDLYHTAPRSWRPDELTAAQLLANVAVSYIVMAADRDLARAAHQQVVALSITDQLTCLPNRRLLLDRMTHALAVAERTSTAVAAVFIDLDDFKLLNDTHGHAAGDTVLAALAHRMRGTVRRGDTLARLGGDEFVLLCENLPADDRSATQQVLTRVTDRITAVLSDPVALGNGAQATVSASLGVAVADPPTTASDLLEQSDDAMYRVKTGRHDRTPRAPADSGTIDRRSTDGGEV